MGLECSSNYTYFCKHFASHSPQIKHKINIFIIHNSNKKTTMDFILKQSLLDFVKPYVKRYYKNLAK